MVFNKHASDRTRNSLHKKRHPCHYAHTSTRNAAARKCLHTPFSHVNDAHVEFEWGTSQLMSGQHRELLVCFVVGEVLVTETSQHHIASVLAKSSQITWSCPHDKKATLRSTLPNQSVWPAGSINALEQADCSDVWRRNKSRQYLQLLSETRVDSEKKHTHNVALRSIEGALSSSTAAFRIRTR